MKTSKPLFASGDEIVAFRRKHALNQTAFWSRVGVTQSCGSRYETGRKTPRPVQILLTVTYGTKQQSARAIDALRSWRDD